jgi:hypothetical protein
VVTRVNSGEPTVGFSSPEGRLFQPLLEVQVVQMVRVRVRGAVFGESVLADTTEAWLDETIDGALKAL